mmetsp:Transcript_89791/g.253229  ORF Transcript_89791/g.253229 Transcript_89791/m.253229 type:complete len:270 (+) Transcript_89791:2-811(+)
MQVSVRSLSGDVVALDVKPRMTIAQLKLAVAAAMRIPVTGQRFFYAGVQLDEIASTAWKQRHRFSEVFTIASGIDELRDGEALTLEHYGIQKDSVINVVRCGGVAVHEGRLGIAALGRGLVEGHTSRDGSIGPPTAPNGIPRSPRVAGPANNADCSLAAHLDEASDLELLVLLRPILRGRPTLRRALVLDMQEVPPHGGTPLDAVAPVYSKGDAVCVWSNSTRRWCAGEVVDIAEIALHGALGFAIQVEFEQRSKWIAPAEVPMVLRPR